MRHAFLAASAIAVPLAAHAQQAGTPGSLPPVRPLGPVEARAAEAFGSLASVRGLPGGRVLVNDIAKRRVLLFDSTLAVSSVVADSTSGTGNAYGGRLGGLIPYRGDSTLFVDPFSLTMLVVDPAGKLGRTMAVPRPDDAFVLTGLAFGTPGFDAHGRLVYRTTAAIRGTPAPGTIPSVPDSTPLVRVDLATRAVDTVTFARTPKVDASVQRNANGDITSVTNVINPLPIVDDWAVLSDGTIAVLRGRDFHADLVGADGVLRAAPRMPYDWQRMSDENKAAFLDSTRTVMEKQRAEMQARMTAGGDRGTKTAVMSPPNRGSDPPARGSGTAGNAGGPAAGTPPAATTLPSVNLVSASELPDYKPPFAMGAARADADGRMWVRLIATTPMPGPVYAVVDGQGRLVDRVLLPAGSAVAGFGPGGIVYLGVRDSTGVRLQRARAPRK